MAGPSSHTISRKLPVGTCPHRSPGIALLLCEESIDYQKKINHLAILVKAVLPSSSDVSAVSKYFQKFLQEGSVNEEDEEDEEFEAINKTLSLRQIRTFALESEVLLHTWRNNNVEPHRYAVGDIGHIPEGGDLNTFTVLCNVLGTAGAAGMEVQHDAFGEKFSWDRGFASGKEELRAFDFPGGVKGYDIHSDLTGLAELNILASAGR